jgi:hypothetical protein
LSGVEEEGCRGLKKRVVGVVEEVVRVVEEVVRVVRVG